MSYFVCLTVPSQTSDQVHGAFDQRISVYDASEYGVSVVTRKDKSWSGFLIMEGSSSVKLAAKYLGINKHKDDHRELFAAGIERLIETRTCWAVSFLGHWFSSDARTEVIEVIREEEFELDALREVMGGIEDDVRYVVRGLVPRFEWQTERQDF